jgi:hypothetical protein
MSEDFDREERAFAEALHKDAPVESFRPLDAEAIKAAARPARSGRTRWLRGMAAAAVLVVGVGIGAALLPRVTGSSSTAVPAASDGYAAGGAVPEAANDRATAAAQPKASPAPGFRWESYRDVQVEVPDTWGYARAPQSDYCIYKSRPSQPYVDLNRGGGAVAAIGCGDALRDDQQAMHLSFTPADGEKPWSADSKTWKQHSRIVGQARITVTAGKADIDLVNRILNSAVVVPGGVNPAGCPVQLPAVQLVELAGLDASELAVCLYDREGEPAGLRSSVVLTGAEAKAAWQSVLAAPDGGGPDMAPATCGDTKGWPMLLLVGTDQVPVSASAGGCSGNGVADAAARGGMRSITRDLCQALMVDPVRILEGAGTSAALCMR